MIKGLLVGAGCIVAEAYIMALIACLKMRAEDDLLD